MVIFEQTLRALLTAVNLVGNRVYLRRAPQKPAPQAATPYIVFFSVAPVNPLALATHTGPGTLIERLYQISIFDESQSRAYAIADSLRMSIDGASGAYLNVHLGHIFYATQTDAYETDSRLFQVIQEYRIMFRYLTNDPPAVPNRSTRSNTHEHALRPSQSSRAAAASPPES